MKNKDIIFVFFILFILDTHNSLSSINNDKTVILFTEKEKGIFTIKTSKISDKKILEYLSKKFNFTYVLPLNYPEQLIEIDATDTNVENFVKRFFANKYWIETNTEGKVSKVVISRQTTTLPPNVRYDLKLRYKNRVPLTLNDMEMLMIDALAQDYPSSKFISSWPLEDIEGKVVSYILLFYIGEGGAPDLDYIKQKAENIWVQKHTSDEDLLRMASTEKQSTANTAPDINIAENNNDAFSDFISFEVSPNYESPPIKKIFKSVPPSILMKPSADSLIKFNIRNNLKYIREFSLTKLSVGFEYYDVEKNQRYFVDVLNNAVFSSWEKKDTNNIYDKRMLRQEEQRQKRIKNQWDNFINQGIK